MDEEAIQDKDPIKMIARRAAAKADELIKNPRVYMVPQEDKALIIAADSMAILGKKTYGKSHEKDVTRQMLKELMGKTHTFVTATKIVYLVAGKQEKVWTATTSTKVTFRKMTTPELELYVTRYDFSRFAAAYSINEMPWDLVTKIDGSYTNVIGLPFEVILPIFKSLKIIGPQDPPVVA
jgi:septum formation protein